jgi:hypothetical protein
MIAADFAQHVNCLLRNCSRSCAGAVTVRVIDPARIEYNDICKLMIGMIVPRPIAFVSTIDAAGVRNLSSSR